MDTTIQIYTPAYQHQVKRFVLHVLKEFGFDYKPECDYDLDAPEKWYTEKGGVFYIMVHGEEVVGTVAVKKVDNETAVLKRLYLKSSLRGNGLGSRLIEKALEFCKERRFKKVELDTYKRMQSAINLYKKKGFIADKEDGETIYMHKLI
jgi:GNAT superfamily N-acetyltransferase